MYNAVLLFFVLSPLAGIVLMEAGAYGADVDEVGYFNGASIAYAAHAALLLFVYRALYSHYVKSPNHSIWRSVLLHRRMLGTRFAKCSGESSSAKLSFVLIGLISLGLNVAVVLVLLFGVGGINVLMGELLKNEFRSTLGNWGLFAYFSRDFLSPGLATMLALLYRETKPGMLGIITVIVNFAVAGMSGLLWGFKASFIFALMSAMVILIPKVSWRSGLVVVSVVLGSMSASAVLFENIPVQDSVMTVLNRATVLQGDSAWKVWDIYSSGEPLPRYYKTLLSILGGRILMMFGINIAGDVATFVEYNWASLLSYTVGTTIDSITRGNTMTGTLFAEGLFALGSPGFLVFSIFGGVMVAVNRVILEDSLRMRMWHVTVIACLYFCTSIVTWINSGGLQALFQLAFFVNYSIVFGLTYLLMRVAGYSIARPRFRQEISPQIELLPNRVRD